MLKVHRRILLKNRVEVVKDLEPNDVLDYLFQENILTENDIEIVKSERTRRARAEILLDTLPRKGPKAFTKFCEALSSEAGSRHLSTLLSTDPENPGIIRLIAN